MSVTTPLRSIDIGLVIRNARLFNVRSTSAMQNNVEQIVADFFDLLQARKISYLLVGGVALLNYVSGRNTEDVDLIISVADLEHMPELAIAEQDQNFARADFRGLRVDLLLTRNTLFEHVRKNCATSMDYLERTIPCSNVEGLVLLKLYALPSLYRQGDFDHVALYETDLTMLLQHYTVDVKSLIDVLTNHLSATDLQSLADILKDIEARIRRFRRVNGVNE